MSNHRATIHTQSIRPDWASNKPDFYGTLVTAFRYDGLIKNHRCEYLEKRAPFAWDARMSCARQLHAYPVRIPRICRAYPDPISKCCAGAFACRARQSRIKRVTWCSAQLMHMLRVCHARDVRTKRCYFGPVHSIL
jgi:hypothetical protein